MIDRLEIGDRVTFRCCKGNSEVGGRVVARCLGPEVVDIQLDDGEKLMSLSISGDERGRINDR